MDAKWLTQNQNNKKPPYRTATSGAFSCNAAFLTSYHRFRFMKERSLIVKKQRSVPFSRVTPKVCIAIQIRHFAVGNWDKSHNRQKILATPQILSVFGDIIHKRVYGCFYGLEIFFFCKNPTFLPPNYLLSHEIPEQHKRNIQHKNVDWIQYLISSTKTKSKNLL